MTVLDYILDGLEAELALERELGVRSVPFDRSLLIAASEVASAPKVSSEPKSAAPESVAVAESVPPIAPPKIQVQSEGAASGSVGFVFLHHRELGAQESEMITRIIEALGKTRETVPIVCGKPIPAAKVYVVLGQRALTMFFPDKRLEYNTWFTSEKGKAILFTRAPRDILRYKEVTPALKKIKNDMWRAIKEVLRRIV